MKKLMIGLLMLAVAGGVFAQVSVSGSARLDTGLYEASLDDPEWYWGFLNDGTIIQANAEVDAVKAWVRFRADGNIMGDVTADLGALALSIGRNRLPVAFWSSYNLYEDGHYGIGPSSTNRANFIQAKIGDFFFGLADSTSGTWEVQGDPIVDPDDPDVIQSYAKGEKSITYLNEVKVGDTSPVIYLGYNFNSDESFSAGVKFVGVYLTEDVVADGVFSFMGGLHGRFALDPLSLGVNVALYGAPVYGPFSLTSAMHGGGKDGMVLEALLDVGVGLGFCDIGIGAGLVMNLADEAKGGGGLGAKIGVSANFDVGGTGFTIVPGVGLNFFNEKAGDTTTLDAGLSFMYSF